ncbi:MAG: hemerythrin family protein [Alphaproteobacteria bacterium]|nr:hemerythrin family protein [Alphaproteobacteria bacterium]
MAIVEWSDDFKLGEAEIDREHWGLFAHINDLSDQHAQGAGDASITSTIDALAAYVDVHFEHEERLMRSVGYPELDSHIELHVALARRVEEYKAAIERQAARFDSNGFTAFLTEWLTDHILHEDMQFAKYHHRH